MSLVGTRPILQDELEQYELHHRARCVAKSSKVQIVTLTHDSMKEVQNYYHVPDNRIDIVSCGWEHMNTTTEDDSILNRLEL